MLNFMLMMGCLFVIEAFVYSNRSVLQTVQCVNAGVMD